MTDVADAVAARQDARPPVTDPVDDDTLTELRAGLQQFYAAVRALVAPRIAARLDARAIVAAGGEDQIITDDEWAELVFEHVEDPIGDSVLDGVIAAAVTFLILGDDEPVASAALQQSQGLSAYAPHARLALDRWIDVNTDLLAQGRIEEQLAAKSPVSVDVADHVAETEVQAGINGGMHTGMEPADVAALRWITMRDLRVRLAHAIADSDTVLNGETFNIGGYTARYPGDPNLPYSLRINCRCILGYVDGSEVRRAVGSTKAELRAKAAELGVAGRSTMNKGTLQMAVLKALCLQGLAGGPDCPDRFDDMNRTSLLALARGQAIAGRHRMNRDTLIFHLRRTLRGSDTSLVAQGYTDRATFAKARKHATRKRRRYANEDTTAAAGKLPTPDARRAARGPLFSEFGGDTAGYVPCVHCGLRLHHDPKQGLALIVPEPIVPWSAGGTLNLTNLVPSCPACFRARGGRGLVSSAMSWGDFDRDSGIEFGGWEKVPRDDRGRWGRGGSVGVGPVHNGFTSEAGRDATEVIVAKMKSDVALSEAGRDIPVTSAYVWKRDHGYKMNTEYDKDLEAATADRTGWSGAKKANATRRLDRKAEFIAHDLNDRYKEPASDEFADATKAAVAHESKNPVMQKATERFGQVPIVTTTSAGDGAAGRYLGYGIMLNDGPFTNIDTSRPLQRTKLSVDESLGGTLRHEYGHHIHNRTEHLHPDEHATFQKQYRQWNPIDITPSDTMQYMDRDSHGLSTYGQTNVMEAFAETFNLVSHPDFDRAKVDPTLGPMVDTMLRIVG